MFDVKFTSDLKAADLTVLLFFEDKIDKSYYEAFDDKCDGMVSKILGDKKLFDRKFAKSRSITYMDGDHFRYITLIGLGKEDDLKGYQLVEIGGKIASVANCFRSNIVSVDGNINFKNFNPKEGQFGAFIAGGAHLASYRFDKYRTGLKDEDKPVLSKLNIMLPDVPSAETRYKEVESILSGIFLARDVISEPSNILYPESYAMSKPSQRSKS